LSDEDKELEVLKAKRLAEMQKNLSMQDQLDENKTLEELSFSSAIYEIQHLSSNSFKLLVKVDVAWLTSSDRVFPVVIDPDLIGTTVSGYGYYVTGCYQNGAGLNSGY
jgi:hypothetical protein